MEEVLLRWGPLILSFVSLVFAISVSRSKASDERFGKIEGALGTKADQETFGILVAKVDVAEDRISRVEGEMRHLPSRDQTHELALALRDLRGEVGVLTEKLKPISHTTERLQEFLIDEAKAKRSVA